VRQTLTRFLRIDGISQAIVVAPSGYIAEVRQALTGLVWPGCELRIVAGAATRQASVRCGVEALEGEPRLVCVHDAARPLVSRATIEAVLDAAGTGGAATAAARPADSVREDLDDGRSRAVDRARFWLVETPQAFDYRLLARAHEHARATRVEASDDAALVEQCTGHAVAIVQSDGGNVKVTTAEDLKLVRLLLDPTANN
jgi:2-C-methyl-D-erythritol 4-phosphate cytidylyltransferase